jgi:hypothetical protein
MKTLQNEIPKVFMKTDISYLFLWIICWGFFKSWNVKFFYTSGLPRSKVEACVGVRTDWDWPDVPGQVSLLHPRPLPVFLTCILFPPKFFCSSSSSWGRRTWSCSSSTRSTSQSQGAQPPWRWAHPLHVSPKELDVGLYNDHPGTGAGKGGGRHAKSSMRDKAKQTPTVSICSHPTYR